MGINEYIKIGQRIKNVRIKKNISQKEMAEMMNLPVSTYANYEADRREMSMGLIAKASLLLNVPMNSLVGVECHSYTNPMALIDDASLEDILKYRPELADSKEKISAPSSEDTSNGIYYLDPEAAEIAQEVQQRPELKILFDASRKVSADDLELVINMIDRLKKNEGK